MVNQKQREALREGASAIISIHVHFQDGKAFVHRVSSLHAPGGGVEWLERPPDEEFRGGWEISEACMWLSEAFDDISKAWATNQLFPID